MIATSAIATPTTAPAIAEADVPRELPPLPDEVGVAASDPGESEYDNDTAGIARAPEARATALANEKSCEMKGFIVEAIESDDWS